MYIMDGYGERAAYPAFETGVYMMRGNDISEYIHL